MADEKKASFFKLAKNKMSSFLKKDQPRNDTTEEIEDGMGEKKKRKPKETFERDKTEIEKIKTMIESHLKSDIFKSNENANDLRILAVGLPFLITSTPNAEDKKFLEDLKQNIDEGKHETIFLLLTQEKIENQFYKLVATVKKTETQAACDSIEKRFSAARNVYLQQMSAELKNLDPELRDKAMANIIIDLDKKSQEKSTNSINATIPLTGNNPYTLHAPQSLSPPSLDQIKTKLESHLNSDKFKLSESSKNINHLSNYLPYLITNAAINTDLKGCKVFLEKLEKAIASKKDNMIFLLLMDKSNVTLFEKLITDMEKKGGNCKKTIDDLNEITKTCFNQMPQELKTCDDALLNQAITSIENELNIKSQEKSSDSKSFSPTAPSNT